MQETCRRILQRKPRLALDWDENSLYLTIGAHQAEWTYNRGQWSGHCTCGASVRKCVHLYAATHLFYGVCRQYEKIWSENPLVKQPGERPGSPQCTQGQNRQTSAPASERLARPHTAGDGSPRLQAELDFNHIPGQVTLRVFLVQGTERELLRMQRIYNMAQKLKKGGQVHLPEEEDTRFLKWLAPQLRKHPSFRQNLYVMTVSRRVYKQWLASWSHTPHRFYEKETQMPIFHEECRPRLHFELTPEEDDWVRISAVLTLPDGQQCYFHEALQSLGAQGSRTLFDNSVFAFSPPVSRKLLLDIFAQRSPRMKSEHIPQHLGPLLENRLDLLQGENIAFEEKETPLFISAELEHGEATITPGISENHVLLPGQYRVADSIRYVDNQFVVTIWKPSGVETLAHFWGQLGTSPGQDGCARLHLSHESLQNLAKAWQKLPNGLEATVSPQLQHLLQGPLAPKPEISLTDRTQQVLVPHLQWRHEEGYIDDDDICRAIREHQEILHTREGCWIRLELEKTESRRNDLTENGLLPGIPLPRPYARRILRQLSQWEHVEIAETSMYLHEQLLAESDPITPDLPDSFRTILRDYQVEGFNFLSDRCANGVGALLADDMGLGKTLQVLGVISAFKTQCIQRLNTSGKSYIPSAPALVVCPASVISVWKQHINEYTPELTWAVYQGDPSTRANLLQKHNYDLILTTYGLVRSDAEEFAQKHFAFVVLDEAQEIRNPDTQVRQSAQRLHADCRIAVTGTPVQNRPLDLWSITSFLNPGLVESREEFIRTYERTDAQEELSQRLRPIFLRRTKEAVAPELPPVTEEVLRTELSPSEKEIYDQRRQKALNNLEGSTSSRILTDLLRLRQICCHPGLTEDDTNRTSSKLASLLDHLREITDEGHSVMIVTQFARMLDLISRQLDTYNIPFYSIKGDTPQSVRGERIEQFNTSDTPEVFLLSLKAAGTGISLTKADYVFVYDPWWNPAAEQQAVERTHRIGQDKPVMIYRMIASGTIEETVLSLRQNKQDVLSSIFEEAESAQPPKHLSKEDVQHLLGS